MKWLDFFFFSPRSPSFDTISCVLITSILKVVSMAMKQFSALTAHIKVAPSSCMACIVMESPLILQEEQRQEEQDHARGPGGGNGDGGEGVSGPGGQYLQRGEIRGAGTAGTTAGTGSGGLGGLRVVAMGSGTGYFTDAFAPEDEQRE
jgi:hypothetical protein